MHKWFFKFMFFITGAPLWICLSVSKWVSHTFLETFHPKTYTFYKYTYKIKIWNLWNNYFFLCTYFLFRSYSILCLTLGIIMHTINIHAQFFSLLTYYFSANNANTCILFFMHFFKKKKKSTLFLDIRNFHVFWNIYFIFS